jgi:hypothetical protein
MFQFLSGTIKAGWIQPTPALSKVSIPLLMQMAQLYSAVPPHYRKFQFLSGTIKANGYALACDLLQLFQFLSGTIKARRECPNGLRCT